VPQRVLTRPQAVAARFVTGPVAHLWSGVVDWVLLVGRILLARARAAR
jgi:hypothetical protein